MRAKYSRGLFVGLVVVATMGGSLAFALGVGAVTVVEEMKIEPPDPENARGFATESEIAIDGDLLVIGAKFDDQLDLNSGAAYVYRLVNGTWTFDQKLAPLSLSGQGLPRFGTSVDVDGGVIAVSAPFHNGVALNAGAVYTFTHDGNTWVEHEFLQPTTLEAGDNFGIDIDLDGDQLAVGAQADDDLGNLAGAVYMFERANGAWMQSQKIVATTPPIGLSLLGASVSLDGDTLVAGAPRDNGDSGAAYIFSKVNGAWIEDEKLLRPTPLALSKFGEFVAIDDDTIAVGSGYHITPGSGQTDIFGFQAGTWAHNQSLTDGDGRGLALHGEHLFIGDESGSGTVYSYVDTSGVWTLEQVFPNPDAVTSFDAFGAAIVFDGRYLVVGAPGDGDTGAAWAFTVNQPPFPDPDGPYVVDEGDDIQLDGSDSFDPDSDPLQDIVWRIDVDPGDSEPPLALPGDLTPVIPAEAASGFLALDTAMTVTLEVSDGSVTVESDSTTLTINNVPPDVAPIDDQNVFLGGTLSLGEIIFADAHRGVAVGFPTTGGHFDATVDWGDGTGLETLAYIYDGVSEGTLVDAPGSELFHDYTRAGLYIAEVCVSDGIDIDCESFTVRVISPVGIDIKPGSDPNSININGNGVIPVAILGSDTFDVTQIDESTLSFAGLEVRVKGNGTPQCSVEDVSGDFTEPEGAPDGLPDLVCQFVDDPDSWMPGDGIAEVTGNLLAEFGGAPFAGEDTINIVP